MSSVFTSELMAVLWALRWIEESRPREVIICSDSAAALEALRKGGNLRLDLILLLTF
jgi:ribonuclease HI